MSDLVELRIDGVTARVSLNRPEVHNAFNAGLIAELTEMFKSIGRQRDLRAVVLGGNGKSFCAGADVEWMRASLDLSEQDNLADALRMSDMFAAIDNCPLPVIARVHGAALGGGMGLIAVCDVVVAAETARFGFTETRLGILPAVISRFVVPRIGAGWARRYFLTGERFGADAALRVGLVHEVVTAGELDDTIAAILDEIVAAGPEAVREAKALIAGVVMRSEKERREYTAATIARIRSGPEGQEGLRAFLEKREPAWKKA